MERARKMGSPALLDSPQEPCEIRICLYFTHRNGTPGNLADLRVNSSYYNTNIFASTTMPEVSWLHLFHLWATAGTNDLTLRSLNAKRQKKSVLLRALVKNCWYTSRSGYSSVRAWILSPGLMQEGCELSTVPGQGMLQRVRKCWGGRCL